MLHDWKFWAAIALLGIVATACAALDSTHAPAPSSALLRPLPTNTPSPVIVPTLVVRTPTHTAASDEGRQLLPDLDRAQLRPTRTPFPKLVRQPYYLTVRGERVTLVTSTGEKFWIRVEEVDQYPEPVLSAWRPI